MDSQFVNYDGRSVHDMINLLLAASGDPEAIRRLQESINDVDQRAQSSISVVNAAVEQLEVTKQDAGSYVTVKTSPTLKAAHLQGSNVLQQLITRYNDDPVSNAIINFDYSGKTIQFRDQPNPSSPSSQVCVFSADSDTEWKTLSDVLDPSITTGAVYGRIKNGSCTITFNNVTIVSPPASGYNVTIGTLPEGYRPRSTLFLPITYVEGTATQPVIGWFEVRANGSVFFRPSTTINNARIYSSISFDT